MAGRVFDLAHFACIKGEILFNFLSHTLLNMVILLQNLTEKSEEQEQRLAAGQEALELVEKYQALEVTLREQITSLESSKAEEITKLTTEVMGKDSKYESDLTSYKEQIKQHSVTICAMEERISKVMKKNKESQEESEKYRKEIQGKNL